MATGAPQALSRNIARMTAEQFTGVLVALTGLIGAVVALWREVHGYHKQVNSRMDELLRLTALSSHAAGVAERASGMPPKNPADL